MVPLCRKPKTRKSMRWDHMICRLRRRISPGPVELRRRAMAQNDGNDQGFNNQKRVCRKPLKDSTKKAKNLNFAKFSSTEISDTMRLFYASRSSDSGSKRHKRKRRSRRTGTPSESSNGQPGNDLLASEDLRSQKRQKTAQFRPPFTFSSISRSEVIEFKI